MTRQDELFQDIQKTLAGHSERDVTHALLMSLIVAIGIGAESLPRAVAVIDALPGEMKSVLRDRWSSFRQHRQNADLRASVNPGTVQH